MSFDKMITTKLDLTRLDKESLINREDNGASRLFNGIQHMYNPINVTKSREKEVVSTVGIPDNMADVLDEVMDYESSAVIAPNMDDHVFDEEDEGEAMENEDDDIGQNLKKLCVTKLYKDGWREINQSKVCEVRQVVRDRVVRKQDVTKYIMKQVKEIKTKSSKMVVCCENAMAEVSSWSSYMHVLRPPYY